MKTASKNGFRSDNALAKQVLEAIARIDQESQQKKLQQLESLQSAKGAILERIRELNHQLAQIDDAVSAVTGRPAPSRERRPRKQWDEERDRVGRWLEGRRGQKFAAGDLMREFPELDGQVMSIFLKPLVDAGKVATDTTQGRRWTKYYVQDGSA